MRLLVRYLPDCMTKIAINSIIVPQNNTLLAQHTPTEGISEMFEPIYLSILAIVIREGRHSQFIYPLSAVRMGFQRLCIQVYSSQAIR